MNSNLETIKGDLEAASDVLMEVNRDAIDSYKLYLPYLGVNDYLKNHSLLMFHALTFETADTMGPPPPITLPVSRTQV